MNRHAELELDFAFNENYHGVGKKFKPEPYLVTLCGHIEEIIKDHDAYLIYMPRYNTNVQICTACFEKVSGIYVVGNDREWEEKIQPRYNHFKIDEQSYIYFGKMDQFQIALSCIK